MSTARAGRRRVDAAHQLRKAVIGLRPDDDIDPGRTTRDFLALGLRDAAGDGDRNLATFLVAGALFHHPQPAKLGKHLLGCLFANVTGVQNDHVGALGATRGGIAERRKNVGHAIGIIDIHLAPVGLDEQFLRHDRGSLVELVGNSSCGLFL